MYIQASIQAPAFRNSKLVNVYSFACFTSIGLELFSVDNFYKWWTYILCSNVLKLLDTRLRKYVNCLFLRDKDLFRYLYCKL